MAPRIMRADQLEVRPVVESLEGRRLLSTAPTSYLINCGGAAYTDHSGSHWSADEDYSGGGASDNAYDVPGTNDDVVFYDRRTGTSFSYSLPVANGTYAVQLFFTDPFGTGAGQRVFNVTANGSTALSHFDVIAAGGGKTPIAKAFAVNVTNGRIDLGFSAVVSNATVSGIQVINESTATPVPTPSPSPSPTPTPTPSSVSGNYLYAVMAPGQEQGFQGEKPQIQVFDVNNNNKWVKNIPLPGNIYNIKGVAANVATNRLYVSYLTTYVDGDDPGGLLCLNLTTDAVIYQKVYPRSVLQSVDRFDITPDGKTIYMPCGENTTVDYWEVIDAATGNPVKAIFDVSSPHDTVVSASGQDVFFEGQEKGPEPASVEHRVAVVDTATNQIVRQIGPFYNVVRPYTINAAGTLLFATENDLDGFQVASVTTGKILYTVATPGHTEFLPAGTGCINHGITLTPDGKYIFLVNTALNGVEVFDVSGVASGHAPTYVKFIPTRKASSTDPVGVPSWITTSYNGKYVYAETGDIISVATLSVIGQLTPQETNSAGQSVAGPLTHSRFMLNVEFNNGKPIETNDQFGIQVD